MKIVDISCRTTEAIDGITIRKEQPVILTGQIHQELISNIDVPFSTYRVSEVTRQIFLEDQPIGALVCYSDPEYADYYLPANGTHLFETTTIQADRQVAVVSNHLAERIAGESFDHRCGLHRLRAKDVDPE